MDSGWVGIQVPWTEPGTHSRQVDSSSQSWRGDHSSGGNGEEVDMWLGPGMISQQPSLLWEGCILCPSSGAPPWEPTHQDTGEVWSGRGHTGVTSTQGWCELCSVPISQICSWAWEDGNWVLLVLEAAEAQHKLKSLGRSGLVWGGKAHELHSPSLRGSLD